MIRRILPPTPAVAAGLVLMLLAPTGAAHAQGLADYDYEELAFRGFGVDYGYIWPERVDPALAYTLRLDLGYLGPLVRIVPSATFWRSNLSRTELERLADQLNRLDVLEEQGIRIDADDLGPIDWTNISVGTDIQLAWIAPGRLLTYFGAGAAVHALNGRGSAFQDTFFDSLLDVVTGGVAGMAGFEFMPTRAFRIYAEGRYTLLDKVRYPGVRVGAALMLPGHADI